MLSPNGQDPAKAGDGDRPGVRVLGQDPATGEEITLRSGRFGDYVQQGEGEKPKRCSLPKGMAPADLTLEQALALLSLPREVARHPVSGEPILAGVGRYGAYVQHGKTYANLGKDEDVLAVGANRAIDLIVAKESGTGGRRFGPGSGRALGEHPTLGGAVTVKEGRFGAYVNHGKINATLPKGTDTTTLTLDDAVAALAAKAAGGGVAGGRLLGEHPKGGPVTVRPGRFGAYVNWGKVNATIAKSVSPDDISLGEAIDLIEEREGRPASARAKPARKAPAAKAPAAKKTAAKAEPPFKPDVKAKSKPAAAAKARPASKPAAKARRKA